MWILEFLLYEIRRGICRQNHTYTHVCTMHRVTCVAHRPTHQVYVYFMREMECYQRCRFEGRRGHSECSLQKKRRGRDGKLWPKITWTAQTSMPINFIILTNSQTHLIFLHFHPPQLCTRVPFITTISYHQCSLWIQSRLHSLTPTSLRFFFSHKNYFI